MRLDYEWLARLLVVLAVLDWGVALYLVAAAWKHRWAALIDRALTAVILAASATIAAILGLNRVVPLGLPPDVAILLLVVAIVLVSVPAVLWLYAYLAGKFGRIE